MKKIDLLKKIEEAKINQKTGNVLAANKTFQELLKSNGNSFEVLYAYGLFCRDLKKFNLSKKVFLNLINNFPSSINSYILLAEILRLENKFNEAERILQKAMQADPNHGDLLYNFSLLYFASRNFNYALTYINKAIKLSTNNDVYKILKAEIYINQYNMDEAIKILEVLKNKKVPNDNNEVRVDILIANAYIKKRKYDAAEYILLDLIRKYKGLELAYLNLSILYRDKNQLNKSIKILKKE